MSAVLKVVPRAVLLGLMAAVPAGHACAESGAGFAGAGRVFVDAGPVFRVDFKNPSVTPSLWTLTLSPDGKGHFHSERGDGPAQDQQAMEIPDVDRDVRVSEQFAGRVFHGAQDRSLVKGECESHMKVAFQGWKRLTYTGPDGQWSCEFNYSKDKEVQELGDSLLAVAGTILEGVRLEMLLQHDRLGLDREMEFISDATADGRLTQLCVIREILGRLADDPSVMERVRKRARVLLAKGDK
jgi:hypothetical protein